MSSEFSPELRKELLDDFYAECDELLTAIRQHLTTAADALAANASVSRPIEGLYRQIHSLKGIAAIAGVRPAEQLAHRTEDLLRAISKGQVALTRERLEVLLDATQQLERIIGAHRAGQPMPDSERLSETLSVAAAGGHAELSNDDAGAASHETAPRVASESWSCTFSPSAELDARGINVTTVRAQLAERGEVLSAVPVVEANAGIRFVFTMAFREPPSADELTEWARNGLRVELVAEKLEKLATKPSGEVAEAGETYSLTPSHMVRVDLARLDELMRIAGEMVIQRSRLHDRIEQQFGGHEILREIDLGFARSLRELRRALTRVRLVPVAEIFTRIPFVIRDLAAGSGKKARVVLEGHQTEIDKYLAERLKEPLLHVVRNAFSHGIESSAERVAAGKPEEATVTLRATSLGETVVIQVRDDGRGVDATAVVERAKSLGLPVPAQMDAAGLLALLCAPGFSTRVEADRAAGRGVGMAVVADTVRELGGTLTLETELGRGTEFTLRLPLTLSIIDAIVVSVGPEICAVPQGAVDEIVQVPAAERRLIRQTEVVPYRGGLLPLRRLRSVFALELPEPELLTVIVLSSDRGATGLVVDRVVTRREVVVRPLADPLVRVPGISGATELGDGRPILILDPNELTGGVVRPAFLDTAAS